VRLPKKYYGTFLPPDMENRERGNILLIILIAIVLLAMLTAIVSQYSSQQSDSLSRQVRDDQISRMLVQVGALGSALHQMVADGEDPALLYSNLLLYKPGDANFETPPNTFKIYHPLGGGISYMASSTPDTTAPVATSFGINAPSIITGVGATDAGVGDIIFTAIVSSASYCQRINEMISGTTAMPVMADATFTSLFVTPATVTLNAGNCAPGCVNVAQRCVVNTSGNAWGFYAALFPG
jgi:hypothetical protein